MTGPVSNQADAPTPRSRRPSSPNKPTRLSRLLDAALWIAALAIFAAALWPKDSGPSEGAPAAAFSLPVVGSPRESFSFDGPRDKPLLVEAFASWCGSCRRSNGLISSLHDAQHALDVVAVSVDDDARAALAAKNSWPIEVPVLHDDGSFQRNYQVSVLPTFILIGRDGTVQDVTVGRVGATDMRRWLKSAE